MVLRRCGYCGHVHDGLCDEQRKILRREQIERVMPLIRDHQTMPAPCGRWLSCPYCRGHLDYHARADGRYQATCTTPGCVDFTH